MAHFTKPAEGTWTQHYPYLSTEPVSYEDSISEEWYSLEQGGIFKKAWLQVGRVELVPKKGSYFTKEIHAANTSIIVVNDGSRDRTAEQLAALQRRYPRLRVATHERNLGYGAALATGFSSATRELIFLTDGSKFTLPVALFNLQSGNNNVVDFGALQSGVVIAAVPCVVIFLILQRFYVRGFTSGAVKG